MKRSCITPVIPQQPISAQACLGQTNQYLNSKLNLLFAFSYDLKFSIPILKYLKNILNPHEVNNSQRYLKLKTTR